MAPRNKLSNAMTNPLPSLAPLVNPKSIAILGASADFAKINGRP